MRGGVLSAAFCFRGPVMKKIAVIADHSQKERKFLTGEIFGGGAVGKTVTDIYVDFKSELQIKFLDGSSVSFVNLPFEYYETPSDSARDILE